MTDRQEKLDWIEKLAPDCSDNSCRFVSNKTGMRTNGGV